MLRYDRQTKPGLVALYDIRPGNGAGPFLQPWSPHGARKSLLLNKQRLTQSTNAKYFAGSVLAQLNSNPKHTLNP